MTTDKELIDGIDGDALPERLYNIKGDHPCTKCGRSLKGKIAYLNMDNDLICTDKGAGNVPTEAILCETFQEIIKPLKRHTIRLTKSTSKKLERALRELLE